MGRRQRATVAETAAAAEEEAAMVAAAAREAAGWAAAAWVEAALEAAAVAMEARVEGLGVVGMVTKLRRRAWRSHAQSRCCGAQPPNSSPLRWPPP